MFKRFVIHVDERLINEIINEHGEYCSIESYISDRLEDAGLGNVSVREEPA